MKTADLSIGDHVAHKSSKYAGATHVVVREFRARPPYGWDRTHTIGVYRYDLPDDADLDKLMFWVRPQEIVSTWADEQARRQAAEEASAAAKAAAAATVAANTPRLKAVRHLARILRGDRDLSEYDERQLLVGRSFSIYIDLDKLEAMAAAIQGVEA